MMRAWQAGERQQALGLVPEKVVDDLFVFGSRNEMLDKIEAYCKNGITTPILNIVPTSREADAQARETRAAIETLAPR
jgi:hypothetical protein